MEHNNKQQNNFRTFEDIEKVYESLHFDRKTIELYPITENEIIEIFNSREINLEILNKALNDTTGIYYNIIGLWYIFVCDDLPNGKIYIDLSIDRECFESIFLALCIFTSDSDLKISNETAIEYCEKIINCPEPFKPKKHIYSMYLQHIALKSKNITNGLAAIEGDDLEKCKEIFQKGLESGDYMVLLNLCDIKINNREFEEAKFILQIVKQIVISGISTGSSDSIILSKFFELVQTFEKNIPNEYLL